MAKTNDQKESQPTDRRVRITPFQAPPPSLGGMPPSGIDLVALSTNSPYCRLERKQSLPLPSQAKKIHDKKAKKSYVMLCSGSFVARWHVDGDDGVDLFLVASIEDDSAAAGDTCMTGDLVAIELRGKKIGVRWDYKSLNRDFIGALPRKKTLTLPLRVLHNFLRTSGAQLHRFTANAACEALRVHVESALVNSEMAEMWGKRNPKERTDYYYRSGLQFLAAGKYEQAEEALVKAMHALWTDKGRRFDINSAVSLSLTDMLLETYSVWASNSPASEQQADHLKLKCFTFSSLLVFAGSNAKLANRLCSKHRHCFLEKNLRQKKTARQTLLKAIRYPNVQRFQSVILGCARHSNLTTSVFENIMEPRDDLGDAIRSILSDDFENDRESYEMTACGNPDCDTVGEKKGGPFMLCSLCKRVYYCQKSCQTAHWKEHRRTCESSTTITTEKKPNSGTSVSGTKAAVEAST